MKKYFILIAFIIFLSSCQLFNNEEPDPLYSKDAKLHLVKLYDINETSLLGIDEEYFYNDSAKVSKIEKPYYDRGIIVGIHSYQEFNYNNEGILQGIATYYANSNDSSGFINLKNQYFLYDEHKNVLRVNTEYPYAPDQGQYQLNIYDDSRLIRTENYSEYGDSVNTWYTYTYDNNGTRMNSKYFSSDSSLVQTITHTYQNELKIKEVVSNRTNQIGAVRNFYYDNNGNLIKMTHEELNPISSVIPHVLKYEYYDE